jgi:hypothetical protein
MQLRARILWSVDVATSGEGVEERFAAVVRAVAREPGVSHGSSGNRAFGHSALKINDKIFAMVSSTGNFVVKLPKLRVDELESSGASRRFAASRGRPMKEWLEVEPTSGLDWNDLAREALAFVRSLP